MYQYAKRYITTLLFLCNNLLILVVISDFTPFLLHAMMILLNGLLIVHVSYDRLTYGPRLLLKVFVATNFYKPSKTVMDITTLLDKVIERVVVNNIDDIEKNTLLMNIVTTSYGLMLNQAIIQNKTATIYIPNDEATYDELTHEESALQVYCVNRNDVVGMVTHIEKMLAKLDGMNTELDILRTIVKTYSLNNKNTN